METFEDLIKAFCQQAGMDEKQILGQDPVSLIFDEKIGVQISHDQVNEEICLASRLFAVDEEEMGAMALLVSQANFERDGLYHAHLAMSEKGEIVLIRDTPIRALDASRFSQLMNEFIDAAVQWTDSIASMSALLKEQQGSTTSDEDAANRIKV